MWTVVILGPVITLVEAIKAKDAKTIEDKVLSFIIMGCSMISAIIAGIVKYGKYDEQSATHIGKTYYGYWNCSS